MPIDPATPDARLSHYRIERLLGAGGMGSVYLARDLTLDRLVAIKFITAGKADDAEARRRLAREARAAAALDHPNICTVYEVIEDADGRPCIVMQYVEGESLARMLQRGPLDVRHALHIAADLAAALSVAHKRGIIHRDLKPQNILITGDRRTKLLDFGIARYREPTGPTDETTLTDLTLVGATPGTPAYMSPEQVKGRPLDGRSDLFALGAVLYECLTGERAFKGRTSLELAGQVVADSPPPVSALRDGISPSIDDLCEKLLEKDPADRLQSADELLGALQVLESDSNRPALTGARPRVPPAETGVLSRASNSALALTGLSPLRPRRAAAVSLSALLLIVAAVTLAGRPRPVGPHSTAVIPPAVIGVLPFRNDAGDPAHDRLAAGLPAALARRLQAAVAVRMLPLEETRETYREQPSAAAVARTLGAGFVIDGALVRAGGTLEVSATLVTSDGRTHRIPPQAATDDPLELYRRVGDALIAALAAEGIRTTSSAPATPTNNAQALAEYSQARAFLERPDVPGNLDHAIRLFESARSKDPAFALALAGLAQAYWAQFQETKEPSWTAKAMAANLDALRIDPSQAEVRMSLAVMYDGLGRRQEAVDELKKVMDLQPENDNPHRVLSLIHAGRGDWEAATAEARLATGKRPSYWRNHQQLGFTYFNAGRYDDAIAAYERVVQLQPDSARGYQALGTTLQAAGRNDEALERYNQALKIRPTARTYSNVGTLHFWRGNYQAAREAYQQALKLTPGDPDLHANHGDALARLGQKAAAAQSYRRAIELARPLLAVSPDDAPQLAALALYQSKLGQHRGAAAAITKAIAINAKDGQVLYAAALVYALAGEKAPACRALTQAIENGASEEEVRHAIELRGLTDCQAYRRIVEAVRRTGGD